jgi:hypothetical protein
MAKLIKLGSAKADDPIYSSGLIIGGKLFNNSNKSTPEQSKPASLDLARAVKIVSAEMNAAMEKQGSEEAEAED